MATRKQKSSNDVNAQRARIIEELERRGQDWDTSTNDQSARVKRVNEIASRYSNNIVSKNLDKWNKMTSAERSKYNDIVKYGSSNAKANFAYNNKVYYSTRAGITG